MSNETIDYILRIYKAVDGVGVMVDSPTVPGLHVCGSDAADALEAVPERIARLRVDNSARADLYDEAFALLQRAQDLLLATRKKHEAAQARIDELMLEYCPEEMTPEQKRVWGESQRASNE